MLLCEISDNKLPLPRLENLRVPSKQTTLQTTDTRKILVSLNCFEHAYWFREFSILVLALNKEWDFYASSCLRKLVSSCHISPKEGEEDLDFLYYLLLLLLLLLSSCCVVVTCDHSSLYIIIIPHHYYLSSSWIDNLF